MPDIVPILIPTMSEPSNLFLLPDDVIILIMLELYPKEVIDLSHVSLCYE